MQSVFEQTFTDYEYIIIDGGSTDGSREYIEQHKEKLAYWVSEKDGGIYDAMNKGSQMAKGNYLHYLNSADTYFDRDTLKNLFSKCWDEDFVFGNQNLPGYFLKEYPERLTYDFFCRDAVPHQATIIKRSFFEKYGPFSEKYSMGGDYKFFLEAVFVHQCKYAYSGITMVNYDMNGISTRDGDSLIKQFITIRKSCLPNLEIELEQLYEIRRKYFLLKNSRWVRLRMKLKKSIGI